MLKEGDVLGVGYRPRTGAVFFTRNGRKMEDAFIGLSRWNFFPTIGADGPCSVHVNLGQAGFVFIEANVKKWGLAPSVGTLAPPPAYGSERGSILLDVGGRSRNADGTGSTSRRSHRSRHPRTTPIGSSPLRATYLSAPSPLTPPPPITPIVEEELEEDPDGGPSRISRFLGRGPPEGYQRLSTGDDQEGEEDDFGTPSPFSSRSLSPVGVAPGARNPFTTRRRSGSHGATLLSDSAGTELTIHVHPPPDSPMSPILNPPTPHHRDIHLQALSRHGTRLGTESEADEEGQQGSIGRMTRREPPAYSPLDAFTYAEGVHIDLPAEVISAALEGSGIPAESIGQSNVSERDRRSRRR